MNPAAYSLVMDRVPEKNLGFGRYMKLFKYGNFLAEMKKKSCSSQTSLKQILPELTCLVSLLKICDIMGTAILFFVLKYEVLIVCCQTRTNFCYVQFDFYDKFLSEL